METKEEVIFIFTDDYPDWESAEALYFITVAGNDHYSVKSACMKNTKSPVKSISNVFIRSDYSVDEIIGKFAGIVLVGGIGWTNNTEEKIAQLEPVIKDAMERFCSIGAVGTGADILGSIGLLNHAIHTGNSTSEMTLVSSLGHSAHPYSGESLFRNAGAIRNGKIVTARNISGLAFARAYLWTLDVDQQKADQLYTLHRQGALLPVVDAEEEFEVPEIRSGD